MNKNPNIKVSQDLAQEQLKDANQCIGIGAGVGVFGFGLGAITGAVCPLCYIVPPALIGAGLIKRRSVRNRPTPGGLKVGETTNLDGLKSETSTKK